VKHDRLAEARIAYGGRGTISDVQRPRYGQELLDIILPF
jgi:flagellar L-ring protein precursor FlgH